MKQSAKGDSNGGQTLSGKDKAKLLKLMREQQKQKDATPAAKKAVQNTKSIVPDNQTSGLPAGFFDATPVSNLSSVSAQLSAPAPQSAIKPAANSNVSNLPQGFFDNPVEDLSARGITMEQFTAKMEKEEQAELDSFLTEVKGTLDTCPSVSNQF